MHKKWLRLMPVLLACGLFVACGKEKRMAAAALKSAETTVASAGEDVARFAPDQWKQITDAMAGAKDAFDRKDYKAVLSLLADITPKVQEAQGAASTNKTRLETAWNEMSDGVPRMVEAIRSRVGVLSASRKLPAGMDKARLEGISSGLASATQTWNEASEAAKAGNLAEAVAKANTVKDAATSLMQELGMTPPPAAGGGT